MRRANQTAIAVAVATTAVTGVAVAGVIADDPVSDPDRPTGTIVVESTPVREDAGAVRVVVRREPGAPARMTWATIPGSATAGHDFLPDRGILQFHPGEHQRVLRVPVIDDGRAEPEETFAVRVDVMPGHAGPPPSAAGTVTILR